jgi:hypothetical protein
MDGEFSYFLLLLFFFWILESIAKARQRKNHPEQMEQSEQQDPFSITVETSRGQRQMELPEPRTHQRPEPTEARTPLPRRRPRNLWEEIAEIARQQMPPEQRPVERTAQRAEEEASAESTAGHGQVSARWEQGSQRELARAERAEAPTGEERTSDRWAAGLAEASSREVELTRTVEAAPRRANPVSRPIAKAPARAKRDALRPPEKLAASDGSPKRLSQSARSAPQVPAVQVSGSVPGVHGLRGASRAELRRILVLQEVLGPPVSLRGKPTGQE